MTDAQPDTPNDGQDRPDGPSMNEDPRAAAYYGAQAAQPAGQEPAGLQVPSWLLTTLISVVIVLWAASLIADFLVKSYDPPATLNLIAMTTTSAVLGAAVTRSLPGRKPKGRNDEES